MVEQPNPASIIHSATGREIQLKAHRCLWSGAYPENSLPAIDECYREAVARAEIDLHLLSDGDFLVLHDPTVERTTTGTGAVGDFTRTEAQALRLLVEGRPSSLPPPLLSEVVALIQHSPAPTVLELDLLTFQPMPWVRIEELVRLVEPVKDRVVLNGYDWNVRRLMEVDRTVPVSYDPAAYLDWVPEGDPEEAELGLPRGAYGYLDAHPLARERLLPVADYLAVRLEAIARLVPGAREAHVRLATFERMLNDGAADAAGLFHRQGTRLDVWTLNAETPQWRERLARMVDAGVDMISSDTPRVLSTASRDGL
jgi:glycerophosphoryl diester phosphodiesterase